jgi:hypothetical protein
MSKNMYEILHHSGEKLLQTIEVTEKNVDAWRQRIGKCRQTPGLGLLALPIIPRLAESAEQNGLYVDSAQFWNEQILIADQYRKGFQRITKKDNHPIKNIQDGYKSKINQGVAQAESLITQHADHPGMEEIAARHGLFVGKMFMADKQYGQAIKAFDLSIEKLPKSIHPENVLELHGMKAEALVMNDQVRAGIELGFNTFNDYENSELGKKLKNEVDESRWVIWRSGCILKLVNALTSTRSMDQLTREERIVLASNIKEVYTQGIQPGIKDFLIRKGQLEGVWEVLKEEYGQLGSLRD